ASRIASARSSTRRVHGSIPARRPARRRAMSLVLSCALIARCTRSIAPNARSIARSARGPAARISTSVPSSGRARLMRTQLVLIDLQKPLHTIGDVPAGESGAADVGDVTIELQRVAGRLAGELRAPAGIAHLAAV